MEQYSEMGDLAGIMAAMGISWVVIAIIIFVSLWKIFQKAGRPGWEGIIPLYNYYILLVEVVGRPAWWIAFPIAAIVLGWVPIIGWLISIAFLVVHIIVSNDLSKAFGKGVGFTIGLVILGFIFFPILAFGNAQYLGKPNHLNSGVSEV